MYAFYELKEFMEAYGIKDRKPMSQTGQNETRQNEREEPKEPGKHEPLNLTGRKEFLKC